jgi:antitoxin ParD1/3/4
MRTNIDIDDKLMAAAMKAGGYATKKETVEAALRILARKRAYRKVLALAGKLKWEGDLDVMRTTPARV